MPRVTETIQWRRCDMLSCPERARLFDSVPPNVAPGWVVVDVSHSRGGAAAVAYFHSETHAKAWLAALTIRPVRDWDFNTGRYAAVMDGA